jgi:hypothetical protein
MPTMYGAAYDSLSSARTVALVLFTASIAVFSVSMLSSTLCANCCSAVMFAERLMSLSDDELLSLPAPLTQFIDGDQLRWRDASWSKGTYATIEGKYCVHSLHEQYLAIHPGPRNDESKRAMNKRYWRACVRALTPWLEERRLKVLHFLKSPLDAYLAPTGGKLQREVAPNVTKMIEREDIEYNSIVWLSDQLRFQFARDPQAQKAVDICKLAKKVRDDMAHLRPPTVSHVCSLVTKMDGLLNDQS